jgi:hypothetical protein
MVMKRLALPLFLFILVAAAFAGTGAHTGSAAVSAGASPTTTNNDDSCDIVVAPAATLLLPYFEVQIDSVQSSAATTLFSVTNVSALPQIVHVTLWTDWAYPVLDFNIYLTGYDVQSLNLYDVIALGRLQPTTRNNPPGGPSPPGSRSRSDSHNPNLVATGCNDLMTSIDPGLLSDIQAALTTGAYPGTCGSTRVGGIHANAQGYATMDVTSICSFTLPTSPGYFASEILFDNVLIGDYQQVNPNGVVGNYAGGNPLVHIRAVPEGGPAGAEVIATTLPHTFYDLYTPGGTATLDRRQPLPSQFAARFIQGGPSAFHTSYKIWREAVRSGSACTQVSANASMVFTEIVRFDEHENATIRSTSLGPIVGTPPPPFLPTLPAISNRSSSNSIFPLISSAAGDHSGWLYLNLNSGGSAAYHSQRPSIGSPFTQGPNTNVAAGPINPGGGVASTTTVRPSQNWVVISMFAESRYSIDFDAASLGNGCSLSPATNVLIGPNGGLISPRNPLGNGTP